MRNLLHRSLPKPATSPAQVLVARCRFDAKRSPALPNSPTIEESGVPGYLANT